LIRLLLFLKEYDWPIEKQHYDWLKVVKRSRKNIPRRFLSLKLIIAVENRFFFFLNREEEVKVFFLSLSLSLALFLSFLDKEM
jgi:hypothetical protein